MILKDFVKTYINHNSIIRLVYKDRGGHKTVANDWKEVDMAHAITKATSRYYKYLNHQVEYITNISTGNSTDGEAINIVIEEIPIDILRDNKINEIIIW